MAEKRILIVDDEPDNLAAMEELLTLWGYHVEGVANGREALEAARRRRPDSVVLDLGLPDEDAFNVIAQLKALGVFVVAFSGWHRAESAVRAAGGDAFVLKPDLEKLEGILKLVERGAAEPTPGKKDRAGS